MSGDVVHVQRVLRVVEKDPVNDGAEGGRVVVDVGHHPVQPMRAWKTILRTRVARQQPRPCCVVELRPPAESDKDGLGDIVEDSEDPGPAGQVQEVFPPARGVQQPTRQRIDEEEEHQTSNTPSKLKLKFSSNSSK